jgi:methoxymalonate biosynthesis acyl carrier protein
MASGTAETHDVQVRVGDYVHRLAGRPVAADEAIISSGLLESIAAVQLIHFVENELGVTVEDDDISLANFDSVQAITALVRAKAGAE